MSVLSTLRNPNMRLDARFPGFALRPARPSDLRQMARMATAVFRDEQDAAHFARWPNHHQHQHHDGHGVSSLPPPSPAPAPLGGDNESDKKTTELCSLRDQVRAAEIDFRHLQLRRARMLPGRHLVVATYVRQPVDYLMRYHGARATEEILGWAEWQEPVENREVAAPGGGKKRGEWEFPGELSDESGSDEKGRQQVSFLGRPFSALDNVFRMMAFGFGKHIVVAPPNSGIVYLPVVLESFKRAYLDDNEEWKRWCKHFIPPCFGREGDVRGRHLVLRSLVVDSSHWGHGIDRELLSWGMRKALHNNWDILTLVPSVINPWTLDAFIDAGFKEIGSLDIFWSSHTALHWKTPRVGGDRIRNSLPAAIEPVTPVRKRTRSEQEDDKDTRVARTSATLPHAKRRRVTSNQDEVIGEEGNIVSCRPL